MALYVVSYDLRDRPAFDFEDYARIYDFLKSSGVWCRPLDSFWLIDTPDTPKQIISKAIAQGVILDNDGLVVLELTGRGDFRRVDRGRAGETAEWLNEILVRV